MGAGHARAHADVWLSDVTVGYGDRLALRNVNLAVEAGTLLAVVGPNGAGKSTLLKAALELIPRASGSVQFFGRPYREVRHRVAYVPQRESVDWDFPVSALEVVAMGLYRRIGWCLPVRRAEREQARAAGQQQRAADQQDDHRSAPQRALPARRARGRPRGSSRH